MNNPLLKRILKIIMNQEPLELLIDENYTYVQIFELIDYAKSQNLIKLDDDDYLITEKGKQIFTVVKPYKPIEILEEFKVNKIDIDFIYVPDIIKETKK